MKAESFLNHAKATLFDISYCKCKDFLNCSCGKDKKIPKLERQFIVDQRTVRKMAIGRVDIKTTKQMVNKINRKLLLEQKLTKLKVAASVTQEVVEVDVDIEQEDEEIIPEQETETEFICKIQNEPSTSSGVKSFQMRKSIPTVALECNTTSISDRSAARIASAVLKDFGIVSESEKSNVIDRSKIRRERKRERNLLQIAGKRETQYPQSDYFDGRKDRIKKN